MKVLFENFRTETELRRITYVSFSVALCSRKMNMRSSCCSSATAFSVPRFNRALMTAWESCFCFWGFLSGRLRRAVRAFNTSASPVPRRAAPSHDVLEPPRELPGLYPSSRFLRCGQTSARRSFLSLTGPQDEQVPTFNFELISESRCVHAIHQPYNEERGGEPLSGPSRPLGRPQSRAACPGSVTSSSCP